MTRRCYLCDKKANKVTGVLLHTFPKKETTRLKWVKACALNHTDNVNNVMICSQHFRPEDYKLSDKNIRKYLIKSAFPSVAVPVLLESDGYVTNTKLKSKEFPHVAANFQTANNRNTYPIRRQINGFDGLIAHLQNKGLLNTNSAQQILNIMPEHIKLLITRKLSGSKWYTDKVKGFGLLLHLYSPEAYKYMRKTWTNMLPNPSLIKNWRKKLDGKLKQQYQILLSTPDINKGSNKGSFIDVAIGKGTIIKEEQENNIDENPQDICNTNTVNNQRNTDTKTQATQGKIKLVSINNLKQQKPSIADIAIKSTQNQLTHPEPLITKFASAPLRNQQLHMLPNLLNHSGQIQPYIVLKDSQSTCAIPANTSHITPATSRNNGIVATGPGGLSVLFVNVDQTATANSVGATTNVVHPIVITRNSVSEIMGSSIPLTNATTVIMPQNRTDSLLAKVLNAQMKHNEIQQQLLTLEYQRLEFEKSVADRFFKMLPISSTLQ